MTRHEVWNTLILNSIENNWHYPLPVETLYTHPTPLAPEERESVMRFLYRRYHYHIDTPIVQRALIECIYAKPVYELKLSDGCGLDTPQWARWNAWLRKPIGNWREFDLAMRLQRYYDDIDSHALDEAILPDEYRTPHWAASAARFLSTRVEMGYDDAEAHRDILQRIANACQTPAPEFAATHPLFALQRA